MYTNYEITQAKETMMGMINELKNGSTNDLNRALKELEYNIGVLCTIYEERKNK